jgi:hypothetical protein
MPADIQPRLLQCTMVTTCTTCFNIKETAVYPQSVVRFYVILRTNRNCVHNNQGVVFVVQTLRFVWEVGFIFIALFSLT